MSRRRRVIHKEFKVDSRYGSPVVARLIDTVMRNGKKSLAERIVYQAIEKSREGSDMHQQSNGAQAHHRSCEMVISSEIIFGRGALRGV
jgi:ribosomal protein S7